MTFNDLKEFLQHLRDQGELHVVEEVVDPAGEVSAVCRENFNRKGPALLFQRVKGYRTPLLVGALGTNERYLLSLGVNSISEVREKWSQAFARPIAPEIVSNAPSQKNQLRDINLYHDPFPVPRWHHEDKNPYIGTLHAVITKDPETGWINIGNYRNELRGKDIMGCLMIPFRHIALHWEKWRTLGKPMPIAVAFGLDPYLSMVSVAAVPANTCEYDIAGGLKGQPIEVARALTCDLLVPARAQIVVEGEVPVDDFLDTEGPFGEFAGYMGRPVIDCQYIKVKAVTYQDDPIYQATYEGRPPNESTVVRSIGRSVTLYEHLQKVGLAGIKEVCVTPGGAAGFHAVVAIRKSYPGHPKDVMANVLGHPNLFVKHCMVVDEDIDPWDPIQVEWAVATRVQASRDVEIIKAGKCVQLDPSTPRKGVDRAGGVSDWMGIDATRPLAEYEQAGEVFPELEQPPDDWLARVRRNWSKYGFHN